MVVIFNFIDFWMVNFILLLCEIICLRCRLSGDLMLFFMCLVILINICFLLILLIMVGNLVFKLLNSSIFCLVCICNM